MSRFSIPFLALLIAGVGGTVRSKAMVDDQRGNLYILNLVHGGLINTPDAAIGIAEILIKELYGNEQLMLQKPLSAKDIGASWEVSGTENEDNGQKFAAAKVVLSKKDGRILAIEVPKILYSPDGNK